MKFIYRATCTVFLIALCSNAEAQEFDFFADIVGGIPISSSLKNFHEELADQIQFDNVETTGNFSYNYGFTAGFRFKGKASVFFTNRVSGAKSSVADFSGFVRLTNELKGYTVGLEYEIILKELEKGKLSLGVQGLVTPSNLTITTESMILNESEVGSLEFSSLDFGGAAGFNYEYSLGFISLRAHLDLNIYVGGKLTLKGDDSDNFLIDQSGDKVTTGWTGLSGGIGVIIPISR